ncbi:MAG: hypothetical protein F4W96_00060 [Chloroflexi bacterium]|nr:hypothetical protein [Chloroflexota bacterium]
MMPKVWVVKASGGERAEAFRKGGYASVGFGITEDLSEVTDPKTIERFCPEARTNRHAVSQVHRFLNEIRPGDYIITPAKQGRLLVGVVGEGERQGKFFEPSPGFPDNCNNRRRVEYRDWHLYREELPAPLRYSVGGQLTVFSVDPHKEDFLRVIGNSSANEAPPRTLLRRILDTNDEQVEMLVADLLRAMGCSRVRRTGKTGDGGVDVRATLNVDGLAEVKLFVQVKRYAATGFVSRRSVQELRSAIPAGGHGLFVSTCDFRPDAQRVAVQPGFPHIKLINGEQLVDLVKNHADRLPYSHRKRLALGTVTR